MALTRSQRYAIERPLIAVLNGIFLAIVLLILRFFIAGTMTIARRATFIITMFMYICSTIALVCVFLQARREVDSIHLTILGTAAGITNVVFADLVLLWRVWVVWNLSHRWVITCPALLSITSGFFGYYSTWTGGGKKLLDSFEVAGVICVAINNIISTSLIAGRIWYLQKRISERLGKCNVSYTSYASISYLVLESGAVYTSFYIACLIVFTWRKDIVQVILAIISQISGILPALIMLLVHLDRVPGTRVKNEYNDMAVSQPVDQDLVLDIRSMPSLESVSELTLPRLPTVVTAPLSQDIGAPATFDTWRFSDGRRTTEEAAYI